MLRVGTAFAVAAILLLSWARTVSLEPHRERGILPLDPPTPYFRFIPDGNPIGRVLVVHGLNASKEFMQVFCAALADAGFEVYSIDLPGHGDSPAGFSALRARSAVAQSLDRIGNVDIIVGHSLGAGIVLDLAHEGPPLRMVLLSPPPTPLDHVDVSRTLVVTGRWDIPAINAFVPQLEGAEWWQLPWAAHSTAIFNAGQTRDIVRWMGGRQAGIRTAARVRWYALSLASAVVLGVAILRPRPWDDGLKTGLGSAEAAAWFVLASIPALLLLKFTVVLNFLNLFAADYLISVVFLTGGVLLLVWTKAGGYGPPLQRVRGTPRRSTAARDIAVAIACAAYCVGIIGFFAGSHFMHFTLSDGRWWRFPVIAAVSFPLFRFDESALRTGSGWRTAISGVLTPALTGASILTGVLLLNRQDAFLVLIVHLMILFWIVLWFLTGVVRRHTGSPLAAALFASLVQGWLFAAWFVTI